MSACFLLAPCLAARALRDSGLCSSLFIAAQRLAGDVTQLSFVLSCECSEEQRGTLRSALQSAASAAAAANEDDKSGGGDDNDEEQTVEVLSVSGVRAGREFPGGCCCILSLDVVFPSAPPQCWADSPSDNAARLVTRLSLAEARCALKLSGGELCIPWEQAKRVECHRWREESKTWALDCVVQGESSEYGAQAKLVVLNEAVQVERCVQPPSNPLFSVRSSHGGSTAVVPWSEESGQPRKHLVAVVGEGIGSCYFRLAAVLESFEHERLHLHGMDGDGVEAVFVVDEEMGPKLARRLFDALFASRPNDGLLGESVLGSGEDRLQKHVQRKWWVRKRDTLLQMMAEHHSLYVYDLESVAQAADKMKAVSALDRVFYAIKANNNEAILRVLHQKGVGFECVSPAEIRHIRALFPQLERERILYTPNFAPREDYEAGFELDTMVNVDSFFAIRQWPEVFRGKEILIRVDPGGGRGHHQYVKTAGKYAKFGVALSDLEELSRVAQQLDVRVVGLHSHVGSGILEEKSWRDTAQELARRAALFPHLKYLDIGGGLGVATKPGEHELQMQVIDEHLTEWKKTHPGLQLWMEPGRFFVATAGVLLAKVTQVKEKSGVHWIGVASGFHALIRPILYNAYHPIHNLTRIEEPTAYDAEIVGLICESGDCFGHARAMPKTKEGDVVLIDVAGAYGHTMSSHYNMREPAKERVIEFVDK